MTKSLKLAAGITLLSLLGVLACCSVPQTYLYKASDTVRVRGTLFNIVSRHPSKRPGIYYNALDMTHGRYADGISQIHMKPLKRRNKK